MNDVTVSRRGSDRLAAGHPWIYRSDVLDAAGAGPGDVVRLRDRQGRFLGMAHYSSASEIALRLLTRRERAIDAAFYRERIQDALGRRERLGLLRDTNAYRLVSSEGDVLPALVIDRYAGWLVVQTLNQGMERAQPDIVQALRELFPEAGILERNEAPVRKLEQLPQRAGVLAGELPDRVAITMNGVRFAVDVRSGQKTGAFLDQRENYRAAARYARGQALDAFTYAGGFALHLAGACAAVEAVDSSPGALAAGRANAALNGVANVTFLEANAFDLLKSYDEAQRVFDIVVLDPPPFARSRAQLEGALRGYKEINLRALKLLADGGVLVTCTCSHHVREADFLETVAAAALDAHKRVTVLERRTQAGDHPILLTAPETLYLKCLILLVETAA
jgi:23S rRNA (cytosine1962-C5)-methyltransferase